MTAWRLGEDASARDVRARLGGDKTALSFVGKLIEWIPADVVALYAALITAFKSDPTDADAKIRIVGGFLLALVAVPLGAWSGRRKLDNPAKWWTKLVRKRMLLAPIAFLIWSPTVPDSGWQDIALISDIQDAQLRSAPSWRSCSHCWRRGSPRMRNRLPVRRGASIGLRSRWTHRAESTVATRRPSLMLWTESESLSAGWVPLSPSMRGSS